MAFSRGKLIAMAISAKANEKGLTLREAAKAAGIEDSKTASWMKGTAEPTEAELKTICEQIGCKSSDVTKLVQQSTERSKAIAEEEVRESNPPKEEPEKKKEAIKSAPQKDLQPSKKQNEIKTEKTTDVNEKKEDPKTMDENIKAEIVQEPKKEEVKSPEKAPEQTLSVTVEEKKPRAAAKKITKKTLFSEETEAFIRKAAGLKKSDEINKKAVSEAVGSVAATMKASMDTLTKLEKELSSSLFESMEGNRVDPRLQKLVDAAANASDEGIEIAISILKKFKK